MALADRLDQLVGFFSIGQKPTGSGDPYALRRAALGIIRIIRENRLRLRLRQLVQDALEQVLRRVANQPDDLSLVDDIITFLVERLRVQLRAEGARHDVLAAVFAAKGAQGADDDLTCLLARTEAVAALLGTGDGANLLTASRRAANILRIEARKDGPHDTPPDASLLRETAEIELDHALGAIDTVSNLLAQEDFAGAMSELARLRAPLDGFFDKATVQRTRSRNGAPQLVGSFFIGCRRPWIVSPISSRLEG